MRPPTSRYLLSVILTAVAAQKGEAVNHIWFEAAPVEGSAGVLNQGFAQVAQLSCLGGRCSWDVTIRLQSVDDFLGWSLNVVGPQLPTPDKLRATSYVYPPSPQNPFTDHDTPQLGFSPNLVIGAGSLVASGRTAPPGTHDLFRFRLVKTMVPSYPFPTQVVRTQIGDFEWTPKRLVRPISRSPALLRFPRSLPASYST